MIRRIARFEFLLCMVLFLMVAAGSGCARKETPGRKEAASSAGENVHNAIPDSLIPPYVPGDKQLWPDSVSFSRDAMNQVVMLRTGNLYGIYHRNRVRLGNPEGTVTFRFQIHPDGSVSSVAVEKQDWDQPAGEIADSMANDLAGWTFPPGLSKSTKATQTFSFAPDRGMR
ncbi:AgmX/PglI C-terminal domain-containing protein [bacterium]|nr:AgmX/PglI C-terminal domain-containing protein [bacterium]